MTDEAKQTTEGKRTDETSKVSLKTTTAEEKAFLTKIEKALLKGGYTVRSLRRPKVEALLEFRKAKEERVKTKTKNLTAEAIRDHFTNSKYSR